MLTEEIRLIHEMRRENNKGDHGTNITNSKEALQRILNEKTKYCFRNSQARKI
jgi:hypothetical protein